MTKDKILFGAGLATLALVAAAVIVISTTSPTQIGRPDQGLVTRPPEGKMPSPVISAPQQVASPRAETAKFENVLTVSGTGIAKASPDRVIVSFTISEQAKTAQAATERASTIFNNLLTSLTAEAIQRSDIQTTSINLNPTYFYPRDQPPQITGYRLDHSITVIVKSQDVSQLGKQAGKIIDIATAAGVTRIGGISFSVGEEAIKILRTQALKTAIEDARDKATTMANALGVKIAGISSVSESVFIPRVTPVFGGAPGAVAAAPPSEIVPGEFQVSVNVRVSYGISG